MKDERHFEFDIDLLEKMTYYGFELLAIAIFSLTKIRHDIFMFLNRSRTTFKISIF